MTVVAPLDSAQLPSSNPVILNKEVRPQGKVVVPYEAPRTDCSLLLLLLQQTREPDYVDAERTMHGLSLDVFIDAYHLGTVEAAEMVGTDVLLSVQCVLLRMGSSWNMDLRGLGNSFPRVVANKNHHESTCGCKQLQERATIDVTFVA